MSLTPPGLALAIGRERRGAAQVFGPYFDDLLLTTFEERDADLRDQQVTFVGVTAEDGGLNSVRWAVDRASADPALVVALEIPTDRAHSQALREAVAPAADRVRGVEVYDGRACLVLGGEPGGNEPTGWLDAVLETALAPTVRQRAEQESVAREWEVAAARTRATQLETELTQRRLQLSRARGDIRELERRLEQARRSAGRRGAGGAGNDGAKASAKPGPAQPAQKAAPPAPSRLRRVAVQASGVLGAQGRRGRMITLVLLATAGLLPMLVLAVLLGLTGGGFGVVLGLALGLMIGLLVLAVLVAGFGVRSVRGLRGELDAREEAVRDVVRRSRRRNVDVTERRSAMIEQLLHDQQQLIEKIPTVRPLTRRVAEPLLRNVGDQVQATLQLFDLVPTERPVPAMSGWAATPDVVLVLVEELLRRRPRLIVECGSGASTLFLALAARQHQIPVRIVCLEHDREFARGTSELLERHGVSEYVEIRIAPLAHTTLPGHPTQWYSESALADLHDIGLLFVDGPPASTGAHVRYPAVPLLKDRFAAECTVVLDDCIREDEREVLDLWRTELPDFEYAYLSLVKGAGRFRR